MKITKQRLKEIIREELSLGDLQSDEKFTGGSPEERLLTLIKARELLAAMSKEELTALSKSLDAEQVAVLRHILANPMYAPMEEGWGQGDRAYQQATQLLGKHAQMHGLRNQVADALRERRVRPQQVQKAVQGASSSYHVAQRLGLG